MEFFQMKYLNRILFTGQHDAGNYEIAWDSKNASAGIYLVRVEMDGNSAVRKVNLIK